MTDNELQHQVLNALEYDPGLDAADIGVSVAGGVVTLRGDVKAYREREVAERVTFGVYGVKAVANDIRVHLGRDAERSDAEIAEAVVNALSWSASVSTLPITTSVRDGTVILRGTAEWHFQKEAATRAVRDLLGVRAVTNHITVRPRATAGDVQARIEAAFRRSAEIDARRVNVSVADGTVTLSGHVHSHLERREAERAAWAVPGITAVDDRLAVVP